MGNAAWIYDCGTDPRSLNSYYTEHGADSEGEDEEEQDGGEEAEEA